MAWSINAGYETRFNEINTTSFLFYKQTERDDNDKNSDESTTITDASKFQWEYVSDSIDHAKKSLLNERPTNYQITTKIDQINSLYPQDFNQLSSTNCSQKFPPSAIIIREKAQDLYIQQNIDIQFVRPSTPAVHRTPIIVREILHKPNQTNSQNYLPRSSSTAFIDHDRSSKPPVSIKRKPSIQTKNHVNVHPRKIIIEYDQVNVTLAKNLNRQQQIHQNQYIKEHGTTAYPNTVFHHLLTNFI